MQTCEKYASVYHLKIIPSNLFFFLEGVWRIQPTVSEKG